MSKIVNDNLILSKTESQNLLNSLLSPDMDALKKRNKLLENLETIQITIKSADSVSLTIPDLNLPCSQTRMSFSEKITLKKEYLKTSMPPSVDIHYSSSIPFTEMDVQNYSYKTTNTELDFSPSSYNFAA